MCSSYSENVVTQTKPQKDGRESDLGSEEKPRNNTKQKRVSFADSDEFFFRDSISGERKRQSWYTAEERAAILDDIGKTVLELRKNGGNADALDVEKYCLRGLEELYHRRHQSRIRQRQDFIRDVVHFQDEQMLFSGSVDDEQLQQLSASFSCKGRTYAHQLALDDFNNINGEETYSTKKQRNGRKFLPSTQLGGILSRIQPTVHLPSPKHFILCYFCRLEQSTKEAMKRILY